MLAIPEAVQETLALAPGTLVNLSVDEERLIVKLRRRASYRLGELLLQCDVSAGVTEDDRAWAELAPAWPEEA